MLAKILVLLVVYQVIEGAVIPQNTTGTPSPTTCSKVYESCVTNDNCCNTSPLICLNTICNYPSDPLGPIIGPGGAQAIPSNPGCGITYDPCTKDTDCCTDFVCSGDKCTEEEYLFPWQTGR